VEIKYTGHTLSSSLKILLSVASKDMYIRFILAIRELIVAVIAQEMLLRWMTAST